MDEQTVQLVRRCLARDPAALRQFVSLFEHRVFGLCLKILGHRQDAEDTTQITFVRAFQYLSSWDAQQPLEPWLLKIAANRCRTLLAKRSKQPQPVETLPEEVSEAKTHLIGLGEEIQQALKLLNEHQRGCFVLFYERDFSIQEIADEYNVPTGTVKTWLHRSRKILAAHLKQRGVAPHPSE